MELTQDTGAAEQTAPHPDDPHQTGSGSSESPGGADAPTQDAYEMSHGQEGYPGPRPGGESSKEAEADGQ